MKITDRGTYTILADDRGSYTEFLPFLEQQMRTHFYEQNVVVDLLKYTHISLDELLDILVLSNTHRSGGKSFIIVNDSINPDDVPDELIVVPTLQEAADVVEMEEIERDLGF
ncbi:MAG TPA: ribonuclease Z [Flavobacteriaceae bacterium]|nr:ribonuclease Z [Flavobacteriaceae bacterium]MCB9213341.1 ribonuclease Z [Alteromonas sp.]HPF10232.1 ribonuclease Z [Flavobacteriaceae bacterium]HQU20678.1 ribonuclease Z [Flavobacteriaceae bacterium]HQU64904.1 ribonuclease Z [Flavobacteriaceae bacterium]